MLNEPVTAELVDHVDVVVHLAAAVGVRLIVESPVHTIETNVHGTEIVLRSRQQEEARRSCSRRPPRCTARATEVPFREDGDLVLGATIKGRWSYACSKAIDEFLALAYHKERRLPGGRLPPLQHRGPAPDRPLRHGHPDLREAGVSGPSDHRSTATAQQSRCFTDVGDVVRALLRLAQRRGGGRAGVQHRQPTRAR